MLLRRPRTFRIGTRQITLIPRRSIHQIRSVEEARRYVRLAYEDKGILALRWMIREATNINFTATDEEVLERAVELLARGKLVPVTLAEDPPKLDPPKIVNLSDLAGPAPQPAPATDWVGLRVVDPSGLPVADEPYRITFKDGTVIEGRTDAKGRARHDGVARGICQIDLPNARMGEWGLSSRIRLIRDEEAAAMKEADAQEAERTREQEPTESLLVMEPDSCPEGTTWLALELEDERSRPVAHEGCKVRLPDGRIVDARLDETGRLEVTGIETDGTCEVKFESDPLATASRTYRTGVPHRVVVRTSSTSS